MSQQGKSFPFLLEMVDLSRIDLCEFLTRNHLSPQRIRIITGATYSRRIGSDLAGRVRDLPLELIPAAQNSLAFHRRISPKDLLKSHKTLVVGVGGGAVLDLAKFHASSLGQPYLAIPTVISNDGIASPIAILAGENGQLESHSTAPPIGILIDQAILSRAPSWTLTNGLGDILSNHSALMDWDLAVRRGEAEPNALARIMSRSAVQSILTSVPRLSNEIFFDSYIDAIVLSGLAMYISGNSRPCSGAEHLIAHVITRDRPLRFGHGFLVGSIAPFVVWLHRRKDRSLLPLAAELGLELDFAKLLPPLRSLAWVIDQARTIRGPRFTILNSLSTREIEVEYRAYQESLKVRRERFASPTTSIGLAVQ